MKVGPHNTADLKKYFGGTFLMVPEVSTKKVFTLEHISGSGITLRDTVNGELGFISFEDGFEYDVVSPLVNKKQWFQYDNRAYLMQRIPARMWRKGICTENTQLLTFNAEGLLRPAPLHVETINGMLNWEPPATVDISKNTSGHGFAINEMFAYCPIKAQLYCWDSLVGKFGKRTHEVFVPKELMELKLPSLSEKTKVCYV